MIENVAKFVTDTAAGILQSIAGWVASNPKMSAVLGLLGLGQFSPDTVRLVTGWINDLVTMVGNLLLV